jgi:FkbM family methyltransferase
MPDKYRPVEEVEFVEKLVNKRWKVVIPKFLVDYHDWWDFWELECHLSMQDLLKPGMLLYDVGAFDGWQSAMFSQFVGGPQNMVLIEPCEPQWSNTKNTWDKNGLSAPKATFMGFAGDHDTPNGVINQGAWPQERVDLDYGQIIKAIKFKLIHMPEHAENTECIKLDTLANTVGVPDAIHIDVEGAGLTVLRGAENILRTRKPIVWIAIHPEFMIDRFNTYPHELHDYMASLGYTGKMLARDHEEHWLFISE